MALAVAAALIAGLAANLLNTQGEARASVRDALERRAVLTGRLISSAFLASHTGDEARQQFGGSPRSVKRSVRREAEDGEARLVVLDAAGRVIAAEPRELVRNLTLLERPRHRHLRTALSGAPAISDAFSDARGRWMVEMAVPFDTRFGRRVLTDAVPVEVVREFADGFFASASAVPGSHGYLLDGRGMALNATGSAGGRLRSADPQLRAALERAPAGSYGDRTFVSARVPASRWRVVLTVPTAGLYTAIDGAPSRAAWVLFAAFAAAICALLAFGLAAARGAQRLAAATERERAARQLAHERLHDPLTGLPNRTLFQDRAERAIAAAGRGGHAIVVLFLDVDRFKRINDSLGHDAGDAVLREVALRLDTSVRATDSLGRLGGDEFVVLCEDVEERGWLGIVKRIQRALEDPVVVGDRQVPVTCSIGVAVRDPAAQPLTAGDLLRCADAAMYRAKGRGGGCFELFDTALHEQALARFDVEVALRRAIREDELLVHYQPIVSLPAGRVHGVEALVRWGRPTGELVPPNEFIPLAEEVGLIGELGEWVLRTAVREVGDWARRGLVGEHFDLSVNVSARQLADPGLPDIVAEALAGWDRPAHRLCLELTETAVMADPAAATLMLDRLHSLGVRLALDDFGIGHSSLGQLARSMPINTLKLDRSFVASMTQPRDGRIVEAVASLADALELSAVAEGVESAEQAARLAELGFPFAQGFHFGRPVDAAAFVEWLDRAGHAPPRTAAAPR